MEVQRYLQSLFIEHISYCYALIKLRHIIDMYVSGNWSPSDFRQAVVPLLSQLTPHCQQ